MKFGVSSLLWLGQWTDDAGGLVERCKRFGFEVIEIPLFSLDFDAGKLRKTLAVTGMEGVGCIALGAAQDLTSSDPAVRAAGTLFLKQCIDKVHEWGGASLGGVIASAIGKNVGRPANDDEWKWSADCLKEVARYAGAAGVLLGLEVINRYETPFINTLAQARTLIEMIGEPNVKILADTYHMNVEEKDFYTPLVQSKNLVGYMHFAENDRGLIGSGHVDWPGIFKGLAEINFTGTGSIESFVLEVPAIAGATNTWRRLAASADTLASEGLVFLKQMAAKYGL